MPQTVIRSFRATTRKLLAGSSAHSGSHLAVSLECRAVEQRLPAQHDVGGQVPGTQLLYLQPVLDHRQGPVCPAAATVPAPRHRRQQEDSGVRHAGEQRAMSVTRCSASRDRTPKDAGIPFRARRVCGTTCDCLQGDSLGDVLVPAGCAVVGALMRTPVELCRHRVGERGGTVVQIPLCLRVQGQPVWLALDIAACSC